MVKSNKLFVGLDPSMRATGIIVLDEDAEIVEQKLFSCKDKECLIEKELVNYEKEIEFITNMVGRETVYMEGPAYQATGQRILQMGAIHFLTRLTFFKKNVEFKVIAPGTLKKFVTGKGNSKKDLMLLKTYKKWGVEFEDDNLCDAYGLARMALEDFKNVRN